MLNDMSLDELFIYVILTSKLTILIFVVCLTVHKKFLNTIVTRGCDFSTKCTVWRPGLTDPLWELTLLPRPHSCI